MKVLQVDHVNLIAGAEEYRARNLEDSPTFGMAHFSLPPGGIIPLHNMPFEVCFMVLSGFGTLTVNDEPNRVSEGQFVLCLPDARRGWRNFSTSQDLEVLVLKMKKDRETVGPPALVLSIADQAQAKNPHMVDVRRIYDTEHALISIITLHPGEKLLKHVTPVDVFFYVLEGSGKVEIGDELLQAASTTLIESPKDIPHCWYNESGEILRVLVVKVPRPAAPTKFL